MSLGPAGNHGVASSCSDPLLSSTVTVRNILQHTFTWRRRHSCAFTDTHSQRFPAGNQTRDNMFCHTLISTSLPLFSVSLYSLFFFLPSFFSPTQRIRESQYASHVSAPPSKNTLPTSNPSTALTLPLLLCFALVSSPVSSTSCQAPASPPLLLFHFVHALPHFSPPSPKASLCTFSPSVSLSASPSLLPLSAPNDFYPLSDLSSLSRGLLLFFALVFRQLVLPLHLSSSSSCATALSTQPVSPSLMRVPVSLCANWRCPSPPSVCLLLLLLLLSHRATV